MTSPLVRSINARLVPNASWICVGADDFVWVLRTDFGYPLTTFYKCPHNEEWMVRIMNPEETIPTGIKQVGLGALMDALLVAESIYLCR